MKKGVKVEKKSILLTKAPAARDSAFSGPPRYDWIDIVSLLPSFATMDNVQQFGVTSILRFFLVIPIAHRSFVVHFSFRCELRNKGRKICFDS